VKPGRLITLVSEVYFSLYDNPQILSTTSLKPEVKIINTNTASQDEFIKILHISEPLVRKIIKLRESQCEEFKEPQDLTRLPEITNLEWEEYEEEGVIIIFD